MIVPTVGRVVWYYPTATDEINGAGPLAALVAHVHSNDKVNLAVFDANGANHGLVGVRLLQDGDFAEVDEGYATWMPYQLGQAAKTEAAEAKTAASLGIDPKKLAESIAQMVTEYVEFGIDHNSDWRSGLKSIIESRIRRILHIPVTAP